MFVRRSLVPVLFLLIKISSAKTYHCYSMSLHAITSFMKAMKSLHKDKRDKSVLIFIDSFFNYHSQGQYCFTCSISFSETKLILYKWVILLIYDNFLFKNMLNVRHFCFKISEILFLIYGELDKKTSKIDKRLRLLTSLEFCDETVLWNMYFIYFWI